MVALLVRQRWRLLSLTCRDIGAGLASVAARSRMAARTPWPPRGEAAARRARQGAPRSRRASLPRTRTRCCSGQPEPQQSLSRIARQPARRARALLIATSSKIYLKFASRLDPHEEGGFKFASPKRPRHRGRMHPPPPPPSYGLDGAFAARGRSRVSRRPHPTRRGARPQTRAARTSPSPRATSRPRADRRA